MKRKAYIYIKYNNIVVLKSYLDIIKVALENIGFECVYVESISGVSRKALLVFPMGIDAFKFYLKGFRNLILWQQGVTAEESFLRHQSKIRYHILNFIDCFIMKKAKFIFFVSEKLRKYYEERASCSFIKKSYLMPCFNETLDFSVFNKKDYTKKTFAYVGSLDLWQCFEQTIKLFSKIENAIPDASLKVLTFQTEDAKKIISNNKIKNYCVKYVQKEQVKYELLDVSYGFIIRDDIEVNRVSTPTKFSSYLAAGVLPIYSECLSDFNKVNHEKKIGYVYNSTASIEDLIKWINEDKQKNIIASDIDLIFKNYFNPAMHSERITIAINKVCMLNEL